MVPAFPTAYPMEASEGKQTEFRVLAVCEVWKPQFAPPFRVLRMVPPPPTAYPTEVLRGKLTEFRGLVVAGGGANHSAETGPATTSRAQRLATNQAKEAGLKPAKRFMDISPSIVSFN
jgi:hypothetical protein